AHTIDARTRTSACPASSCGVGTLSTATSFGARKTTARIVGGITSAGPRRSIVLMAGAPSWFHDHFEGAIDPFVERAQGLAELRQLEVVRDELRRRDAAVGDERDDLFHRAPVRAHSVEIDLFEDDLLEVDRRGLLRDPGEGDAAALADHLDRLAHRVLRAGGIDGDVRAEAAGPLAHGRDRVAVVVVDRLEPERLSAVEPLPAAHDDDARRAEGLRAYRGEQAHAARADRDEAVTGRGARPLHRAERDRDVPATRVPGANPNSHATFPASRTSPDHSWPGMNGYAFGQRPWNVPSMISASVPQMAIAFTRHRTSFSRTGPGLVTSVTS